jgi:hypothetical protein
MSAVSPNSALALAIRITPDVFFFIYFPFSPLTSSSDLATLIAFFFPPPTRIPAAQ